MLMDSKLLQYKPVRIIPPIIDSILLLSGIILVISLYGNNYQQPWLVIKIVAIFVYILLGAIALNYGRTKAIRIGALISSWTVLATIFSLAITRPSIMNL